MTILFDSHALVWFLVGDERFPQHVRMMIEQKEPDLYVSAVSVWEIAVKAHRNRWPEGGEVLPHIDDLLDQAIVYPLPITIEHAKVAASLPGPHRDPFDRMLAAQAQVEGLSLVSADPAFGMLGVPALW